MIELQFSGASDPGSAAIKVFERGPFSHVDAVLPEGLIGARSDRVGGMPPGVQLRPFDYHPWSFVRRVQLPATAEEESAWRLFLLDQIGLPYDNLAIAAFPFGQGWHSPGHWICSGLQSAALTMPRPSWLPHAMAHPPEEVTPFELFLIVSPWGEVLEGPKIPG